MVSNSSASIGCLGSCESEQLPSVLLAVHGAPELSVGRSGGIEGCRASTFADQAVIAIENVRLFKELQARTADLTRSVGQLTALGDVGRAVSSTLDLQTVLATIVSRAVQLSEMDAGAICVFRRS